MNERQEQKPTYPVAGWDAGYSKLWRAVALRLLSESAGESEPYEGLMYAMTPEQARELARDLLNSAGAVE